MMSKRRERRTEDVGSLRLRGLIERNSGEAERAKNAGLQLDWTALYLLALTAHEVVEPYTWQATITK
jgi:hypothetical protein